MIKSRIKKIVPASLRRIYNKYYNFNQTKDHNVECKICNSTFKEFESFGVTSKRKNALCYNCGSLERHRLLYDYLSNKSELFAANKQIKLLHFAPEKIFYDILSNKGNIDYTPCDLFPENYQYNGSVKVEKVNITSIPYGDNTFGFILCNHVLEHIPDDNKAISELYRVMKSEGVGIFQVPIDNKREKTYEDFSITDPKEREKAFGQDDHVRWYGQDYKNRLEKAGFLVNKDDYVMKFTKEELYKYGFDGSEFIYTCSKK